MGLNKDILWFKHSSDKDAWSLTYCYQIAMSIVPRYKPFRPSIKIKKYLLVYVFQWLAHCVSQYCVDAFMLKKICHLKKKQ